MNPLGLILKFVSGRHNDIGRAGYQIIAFKNPVDTGFTDECPFAVGYIPGQFPWAHLGQLHRKLGQLTMEVDFLEKKCKQLGIPVKGRNS